MRPSECAKVSGSRSSGSSGTTLSTAEQDAACLGDQWRHQHWSAVLVSIRVRGTVMTAGCGRSLMDGVAWVWQVAAEVVRVRPSPRVTARIKKWGEQSQRPLLLIKKKTYGTMLFLRNSGSAICCSQPPQRYEQQMGVDAESAVVEMHHLNYLNHRSSKCWERRSK